MEVIQKYMQNSLRNFNYLIVSEKTSDALFFDPFDIDLTLPLCLERNKTPQYLLNTHHHPDHIRDNQRLLDECNVTLLDLKDGEVFELADGEEIHCQYTPGHVDNHKCYFLYQDKKLVGVITGDTVFNAGVGNCKNGGNPTDLYHTIKNIFVGLPDDVIIYPSHDYLLTNLKFALSLDSTWPEVMAMIEKREAMSLDEEFIQTTIGIEKKINPFFKAFTPELQAKWNLSEKELFIELRKKRDQW